VFAPFENLHDNEDIIRTWVNIKDVLKISAKGSHKSWFDEESSQFSGKQAETSVTAGSEPK
jgi:hypothetical protein